MQGSSDAHVQDIDHLVAKAQGGDRASLAALYEHFYDPILRYVAFKTGDSVEAEDITEEVFLRMLESIHTFKPRGYPFSSWLFRIAHNLTVDHFRRKGRHKTTSLEAVADTLGATSADMDHSLDLQLSAREISLAMQSLTTLQREVLTLRFAAGLSLLETARAVGKNENAVKALQHAGLKKLKSLLTGERRTSRNPIVPLEQREV